MEAKVESGVAHVSLVWRPGWTDAYVRNRPLRRFLQLERAFRRHFPSSNTCTGPQKGSVPRFAGNGTARRVHVVSHATFVLNASLWLVAIAILVLSTHRPAVAEIIELAHYDGFRLWLDCERRGAVQFAYTAGPDVGDLPRRHSFSTPDEQLPERCQQQSAATYGDAPERFDRGHLVPANHLDHLEAGIAQSNYMTNVLPQRRNMNRRAWLRTEEITECYPEEGELHVVGGVVYGRNPHDDYFLESHGVPTPDYFWKVVQATDDVIAWFVPNSHGAKRDQLDNYLISVHDLERYVPEVFGDVLDTIPDELRTSVPATSWKKPDGCDLS